MHGKRRKSGKPIGHCVSFAIRSTRRGQSRQQRPPSSRSDVSAAIGNGRASIGRVFETIVSHLRYAGSLLFFAARSDALVSPPPRLIRFNESRMPWVGIGARLELSVRELTPIQEISEDSRPYSIFGQRFMTTLRPADSAFSAAASSR